VAAAKEKKEKEAAVVLLLKTLEDMLHNRITEKKKQIHKTQSIEDTERLWTEIDTLRWVLSQSLSVRRRGQTGQDERYY
jgi:hypothetical protein